MSESSFLEKLLDGAEVEWLPLGEAAKIQRGASPRPISKYITDSAVGVPWIKIGDTKPGSKYVERTAQKITPQGAEKSGVLKKGDFILSNSMSFGRPYVLGIDGAIHDGWASISNFSGQIDSGFLYHFLSSHKVQSYWLTKINSGSVSNLNSELIKSLTIPIPHPNNPEKSLAIQAEIVRILDTFTELTAELTTELTARKKQFNFYRDKLLTFEEGDVEWKALGDVCSSISAGGDVPKICTKGQTNPTDEFPYPIFANATGDKALYGYTDEYKVDSDAVTISARGAKVGYHTIRGAKFTPIIRLITLVPDKGVILTKYLNYALNMTQIGGDKGGIPQLTVPTVKKITIPIPHVNDPEKSLAEQSRIVAILDKFDTLTHSISEGLPREIELRRNQYEYYRDLLLNFPKPEPQTEISA